MRRVHLKQPTNRPLFLGAVASGSSAPLVLVVAVVEAALFYCVAAFRIGAVAKLKTHPLADGGRLL